MKICYLSGGFTSGGIGRVVSVLANAQAEAGRHKIYSVTLFPAKKEIIYHLDKSISTFYLCKEWKSVKKVLFLAAYRLRKIMKENGIDIVIACGNTMYPIALLAGFRIAKTVCWEHSNIYNTSDNDGQAILRWFATKFADHMVTLTDADKKGFIEVLHARKITRIYNPIDPVLLHQNTARQFVSNKIMSVGRFEYQKYFEIIPEIAAKLNYITDDWEWHIYGSGSTLCEVREKAVELGVQDRLVFKGQVTDLYERYQEYALIVMTSRYEGFPMTLLEAAANSLPMVSFNVRTGPDEIIVNGENGYLTDFEDIDSMAERISSILLDRDKRTRMSENSFKTAEKFSIDKILTEWDALFEELLS